MYEKMRKYLRIYMKICYIPENTSGQKERQKLGRNGPLREGGTVGEMTMYADIFLKALSKSLERCLKLK